MPHWADRRHGVGALVGCGTVEDGKKLRSERVIDFDHVDGPRDLPRYSGDDEGLSWPWICHGVRGARVSERCFSRISSQSSLFFSVAVMNSCDRILIWIRTIGICLLDQIPHFVHVQDAE